MDGNGQGNGVPPQPSVPGGRIKGEGAKAFEAFTIYREMGPARSHAKVGQALGKSTVMVGKWSVQWNWVERVAEWDDYADLKERERDIVEREKAVSKMNKDHATLGRAAQVVASRKLAVYEPESETAEARDRAQAAIDALSAGEATALMREGAKLERLARGETTERLEVREAQKWVDRLLPIAMTYIPDDSHEAFLTDVEAVLGLGTGVSRVEDEDA